MMNYELKGAVARATTPFLHSLFVHDGDRSPFAGPDADGVVQTVDENLAIARFACLTDFLSDFDDFIDRDFADDCFDFDTWQEVDVISLAAIDFNIAFLEAAAKDLADCHTHDTDVVQGLFQLFQFTRTSDDFYFCNRMFFHSYHLYKLRPLMPALLTAALSKDALPSGVFGVSPKGLPDMIA